MPNRRSRKCNRVIIIDDNTENGRRPIPRTTLLTLQLFPLSSSSHQGQASSSSSQVSQRSLREEDLVLRLGLRAFDRTGAGNQGHAAPIGNRNSNATPEPLQISCKDLQLRLGNASSSRQPPAKTEEVKLKCSICMGPMKEETSTLCGHLFCWQCIVNAIWMHGRCPSCLMPLFRASIHRIFLPDRA